MAKKSKETPKNQTSLADLLPSVRPDLDAEVVSLGALAHPEAALPPDEGMVRSVKSFGVIEPIVVTEIPEAGPYDEPRFRIRDGIRRYLAAKEAGIETVNVVVVSAIDDFSAEVVTLALNSQRSENPLAEFEAIRDLFARGYSDTEVQQATGMPVGTIRKRMTLKDLIPELMTMAKNDAMTVSAAEAAAKLPVEAQNRLVEMYQENPKVKIGPGHVRHVREVGVTAAQEAVQVSASWLDDPEPAQEPAKPKPAAKSAEDKVKDSDAALALKEQIAAAEANREANWARRVVPFLERALAFTPDGHKHKFTLARLLADVRLSASAIEEEEAAVAETQALREADEAPLNVVEDRTPEQLESDGDAPKPKRVRIRKKPQEEAPEAPDPADAAEAMIDTVEDGSPF